jgi:hypothetical protein
MRAGLLIGEPHVVRYTVPVSQTVPELLPGTLLVAEARAIDIAGRAGRFAVVVEDSAGDVVAAGVHALCVIDAARFRDRLAAKRAEHRIPSSAPGGIVGRPSTNRSRVTGSSCRRTSVTVGVVMSRHSVAVIGDDPLGCSCESPLGRRRLSSAGVCLT